MRCSLSTTSKVIECCARLQNYIINTDIPHYSDSAKYFDTNGVPITQMAGAPSGMGYFPTWNINPAASGYSITREAIVAHIAEHGYHRPLQNILRNEKKGLK